VSGPEKPYIALLRGVNLGARNKVPMATLRQRLEDLGYRGVTTYIQSGNVVLWAAGTTEAKVGTAIERTLESGFGVSAPVLVRTRAQWRATASKNPLLRRGVDPKSLHVTFLASKPAAGRVRSLHDQAFPPGRARGARPRRLPALPERLRPLEARQCLPRVDARNGGDDAELDDGRDAPRPRVRATAGGVAAPAHRPPGAKAGSAPITGP
jgi:uncharacterized protein (DUF1697 family)